MRDRAAFPQVVLDRIRVGGHSGSVWEKSVAQSVTGPEMTSLAVLLPRRSRYSPVRLSSAVMACLLAFSPRLPGHRVHTGKSLRIYGGDAGNACTSAPFWRNLRAMSLPDRHVRQYADIRCDGKRAVDASGRTRGEH
jgi:hypothetical protein